MEKNYNSSTTAHGISRAQKIGKKYRKRPGSTTDTSTAPSTTSSSHEKFN